MRFFWLLLCLWCWVLPAHALDNELQSWDQVTLQIKAPHRILLYTELQSRAGLNHQGMDKLLIRPAVGFQATPKLSLWQGYAWVHDFRNPSEHRIFQQVLHQGQWRRLKIGHRVRLEQRWIDNAGGTAIRGRYLGRLAYPLDTKDRWRLVGSNEFFWNLNDTKRGPQAGFDQNRIYLGVNRKLNKSTQAELGYLLNLVNRQSPGPDKVNHAIMLILNLEM